MQLNIMLVDKCNLKCRMCKHRLNITGKTMSLEDYETILRNASGLRIGTQVIDFIRIDGGREALLYPQVEEAVFLAKKHGFGVTMASNAVLLSPDLSKKLLQAGDGSNAGVDFINFSVTGLRPQVYKYFQGYGKTDERVALQLTRVKNNIREFVELRNELKPTCSIRISYIISSESIHECRDAILFWKNVGVDSILCDMDFENLINESDLDRLDYKPSTECIYSMTIATSGDVYACCKSNENIILGNVFEQPLDAIVSSPRFYSVAKAIGSLDPALMPKSCRICPGIGKKRGSECYH